MTTIGALLGAGGGTRFTGSSHKLLAHLRGRTVVRWSIDALLGAGFDEVAIVVGAVDLSGEIPSGMSIIENPDWSLGQATSLALAIDLADRNGHEALVIGLADQPFISARAWRAVGATTATPIAAASFNGDRRPPVRLARSIWPEIPRDGDEGARVVMRAHPELVTAVEVEGIAMDIDDLDDLARAAALCDRHGEDRPTRD